MLPFELARLNSIAREILRLFHWFKKRGMGIFMSQAEIARRCRCCRATVNRWIDRLCERGFIERARRTPRFWLYVLVTAPVTSGVTSQHTYPFPNGIDLREQRASERKPPQRQELSPAMLRALEGWA
jgi:hypothetical protein